MNNKEFIKKYGALEFNDLTDSIGLRLGVLRANRQIGAFKINVKKKTVTFFTKNGNKAFDLATIFYLTDEQIQNIGQSLTVQE